MIEIKCTKAQYDRLIECAKSYYNNDSGKCFLGKKIWLSCQTHTKGIDISCEECLREHIKRIPR